jgi:type IV pilus assembly protein PilM
MRLTRQKKTGAVVGLDIEAGSIAATEVVSNGSTRVSASAIGPLAPGAFHEGEVLDGDSLAEGLRAFFAEHKLGKQVRLGIANQRVVVRTLRLPAIEDPKEMEAAVRFQAQEQIPMPLDQAVLEHQVVGGVPGEDGSSPQIDVVVVAARRDMVSTFLAPLRSAGLEPVGVDLSAFAMIRALAGDTLGEGAAGADGEEATRRLDEAVLYCNVGDVTNLAVARDRACLFTRVSHVGLEAIAGRLASAGGLAPETAMQWLEHVGLETPVEEIEGEPETVAESRRVLEEGVAALSDEIRLSLDYYAAQAGALRVGRIVLCGAGSAIAGMEQRMEGLGLPISVARPPALADLGDASAARLTLPYGLALES